MKPAIKFIVFGIIFLVLVMLIFQKNEINNTFKNNDTYIDIKGIESKKVLKEQEERIYECDSIQRNKDPNEKFVYTYKDPGKKGIWKPGDEITENEKISSSFQRWVGKSVQDIILEDTTPSGDWYRIDNYCFDTQEKIVRLHSDLRTFHGDMQVIRNWIYNTNGEVVDTDVQIFHLDTQQPLEPDIVSFIDNSPYLVVDYNDLLKQLGFTVN